MSPSFEPSPEPVEVLDLAGLYLSTARRCLDGAAPGTDFHDVQERLRERNELLKDAKADGDYDTLEDLAISMESDYSELLHLQREPLRNCALANVLSALAVEAHINRLIEELVQGDAKTGALLWASVPAKVQSLLEDQGADPLPDGEQPYSDLKGLWRRRSNLVHYVPEILPFDGVEPPALPSGLGLTPSLARHAVSTAEALIAAIHDRLGIDRPRWLSGDPLYFIAMEHRDIADL